MTYWYMGCLVINMYKGSLNVGKNFDFILQLLAEIVGLPQRCIGVHYYVNLDEIILTDISN